MTKFCPQNIVVSLETVPLLWNKVQIRFSTMGEILFSFFFCSFETEQLFETNRRATIVFSFIECILFSLWTNVYVSFRMFLYYVVGICVYTIYPFNFLRVGVKIFFVSFFFPQYCSSWSNVYTVLSSLDDFTGTGILFRVQGEINVTHDIFYKFFFFKIHLF